jgi:hypothetical protein
MTEKKNKNAAINWTVIEPHWRAGLMTKIQISNEFNVSRAAMDKHFNKLGIKRDLADKIREEANAIVLRDTWVTEKVTHVTDENIIATAAKLQSDIILNHRKDITRYRSLCGALLDEIELQTGEKLTFDKLIEIIDSGDDAGMDRIYKKALSTSSRVDSIKKLVDTLKVLIGLERQAFGLSDNSNGDADKQKQDSISDLFSMMSGNVIGVSKAVDGD